MKIKRFSDYELLWQCEHQLICNAGKIIKSSYEWRMGKKATNKWFGIMYKKPKKFQLNGNALICGRKIKSVFHL